MNEEFLIATLEQTLRQFQQAKVRLEERLEEVRQQISIRENEAEELRSEIRSLDESAARTDEALNGVLNAMRKKL